MVHFGMYINNSMTFPVAQRNLLKMINNLLLIFLFGDILTLGGFLYTRDLAGKVAGLCLACVCCKSRWNISAQYGQISSIEP